MKNLFLIYFTALFFAVSCSNKTDDMENYPSDKNMEFVNGSRSLSEEEATETFKSFVDGLNSIKSTSGDITITSCKKKTLSEYTKVESPKLKSSKNKDIVSIDTVPIYEFTLSENGNEGFALVVGHSLYNDVLAYVPEGSLADTIYNEGLALFVASMPENISSEIEENYNFREKQSSQTKTYWQDNDGVMKVLDETEEYLGLVWGYTEFRKICPYDRGNGPWTEFKQYGSPIFTQWGQEAPYNNRVSTICSGVRAKIGCASVAVSQIINHHRVGSYNWSLLNSTQQISPSSINNSQEVSRLMINISDDLGTIHKCKDDGTTSGWTYLGAIEPTLNKNGLTGILQPEAATIKTDTIRNNVSKNMPVLMIALTTYDIETEENLNVGHIWIVDGLSERYRDYYYWVQGWNSNDDVYFRVWKFKQRGIHVHCNWGWSGSSDGWYRFFRPVNTGYNFKDYRLVTQIRPK